MITADRAPLLVAFQTRLGYTFRHLPLLDQALTHRSYVHETPGGAADYERLEFLGDAVLGMIVSAHVYTAYPRIREGQLSQLRARLVNQEALARLARQLDLGRCLRLGRGEDQQGGRTKASLLAAALEAVIGALYLDGGYLPAQEVVLRHLRPVIEQGAMLMPGWDYKSQLQAQTLRTFGCLPAYRVVRAEGPAHHKSFHVELTLHQQYTCIGIGRSKKAAEQHAAKQLLELLQQGGE